MNPSIKAVSNFLNNLLDREHSQNKPLTIPNIQGTWGLKYKVLRVEREENIPQKLAPDYFESKYKFRYAIEGLEQDKNKNAKLIIKQDKEDKRFCVIFEQELPGSIRPIVGYRPGILTFHGIHDNGFLWELTTPDYDDNGVFKLIFLSGPDNKPQIMNGIYSESGYSELGEIQAPTVGNVEYTKINSSIKLPENVITRCVPYEIDLDRNYFLMESDNFITERSVENNDDNLEISEFFYNRLILHKTTLNKEELEQFSKDQGVNFQYAYNFQGPLFNVEKTEIIGMITTINGYKVEKGVNECIVKARYRFFEKSITLDKAFEIRDYVETKTDYMKKYKLTGKEAKNFIEFTSYYQGKLNTNNFLLGELTIPSDQITTNLKPKQLLTRAGENTDSDYELKLSAQSNGDLIVKRRFNEIDFL
jgi:hypothetical protein